MPNTCGGAGRHVSYGERPADPSRIGAVGKGQGHGDNDITGRRVVAQIVNDVALLKSEIGEVRQALRHADHQPNKYLRKLGAISPPTRRSTRRWQALEAPLRDKSCAIGCLTSVQQFTVVHLGCHSANFDATDQFSRITTIAICCPLVLQFPLKSRLDRSGK